MAKVPRRPLHDAFSSVLRAPGPADAAAIGRMHYESWRTAYADLLPAGFWNEAAERRWIERWTANLMVPPDGVVTRVADREGAIVGFASSGPGRANATAGNPVRDQELWALYVRSPEYGTGEAHRLLESVLPAGTPAELWVFEANRRAIAFYAKHGFVADGARHVFGPELNHQPEIRMVR